MIRPATFVAMLVFVFAGLFLYQTKHRSQLLDREIAHTMRAADEARGRTNLLRAEYALLNDPGRLQDLSEQVLKLRPTVPTQFTSTADLPRRLPAIGPMPGAPLAPVEMPAADPVPAPAAPQAVAAAKPASPVPPPAAPAPRQVAARPAPPAAAPPAPVALAAPPPVRVAAAPVIAPVSMIRPAPRPGVVLASTGLAPTSSAEAIRQIVRGGRVDTANPVVASALGMARAMGGPPDIAAQAAMRPDTNRN